MRPGVIAVIVGVLLACRARDEKTPAPAPAPATDPWASHAEGPRDARVATTPPPKLELPAGVEDLTATLAPIRDQAGLPALAAAVWRDDHLVAFGLTGIRDASNPDSWAQRGDPWQLGSDTKAMTALLVGIFVDRGKLAWTDTLGKLFPDEKLDPKFASVTVEELLQHRSGLPGIRNLTALHILEQSKDPPPVGRLAVLRAVLREPPAAKTFDYSNTGYLVVGAILDRVAGKPWEQLIHDEIFTPLGMTSCGLGAPPQGLLGHGGFTGHFVPIAPSEEDNPPPGLGPAGAAYCSLEDWGRFLVEQLPHAKPRLVRAETLARLHTPQQGSYAGGWVVNPKLGGMGHSGSNNHWYVSAFLSPTKHVAIVAATNCKVGEPIEQLVKRLADDYAR